MSSIGRQSCEILMKEKTPLSHKVVCFSRPQNLVLSFSRPQNLILRSQNQIQGKLHLSQCCSRPTTIAHKLELTKPRKPTHVHVSSVMTVWSSKKFHAFMYAVHAQCRCVFQLFDLIFIENQVNLEVKRIYKVYNMSMSMWLTSCALYKHVHVVFTMCDVYKMEMRLLSQTCTCTVHCVYND